MLPVRPPKSPCRARPHEQTETGTSRHTLVWLPDTGCRPAHELYGPAVRVPPELRDHPDRCPPLGTGLVGGRAMRASCYSDRSPDHHRRRVTPRSSFPVSLAVSRVCARAPGVLALALPLPRPRPRPRPCPRPLPLPLHGYLWFTPGAGKSGSQWEVRLVRKDCSRYVARPTSPRWSQPKTLPLAAVHGDGARHVAAARRLVEVLVDALGLQVRVAVVCCGVEAGEGGERGA